ncbi:MAG: DNA-binding protein [Clostridia bacterium]|nr:DNA-binding protein [Clostridia bacterium]
MCKVFCFTPVRRLKRVSKNLSMSLLLDFYGEILSEPQREAMDYFYNGDLSLSEISELIGITRQGVRDRLVKSEEILTQLENKLGLAERFGKIEKNVAFIIERLEEIKNIYGAEVSDIISVAEDMKNI